MVGSGSGSNDNSSNGSRTAASNCVHEEEDTCTIRKTTEKVGPGQVLLVMVWGPIMWSCHPVINGITKLCMQRPHLKNRNGSSMN